jgi:hypothetical protein
VTHGLETSAKKMRVEDITNRKAREEEKRKSNEEETHQRRINEARCDKSEFLRPPPDMFQFKSAVSDKAGLCRDTSDQSRGQWVEDGENEIDQPCCGMEGDNFLKTEKFCGSKLMKMWNDGKFIF